VTFIYKGILARRLPHDPDWVATRTFSNLRNMGAINAIANSEESATPRDVEAAKDVQPQPRNLFANQFFPPDLDRRIAALYEVHGIEHGDDDALLFALVRTHVPGLTVERASRGPARTWNPKQRAALRIAVEEYIAGKKASVTEACMHLAVRSPWKELLRSAMKRATPRTVKDQTREANAMRRQYALADDDWVKFVRDERALERWERGHPGRNRKPTKKPLRLKIARE
jgi:hypothetical protein